MEGRYDPRKLWGLMADTYKRDLGVSGNSTVLRFDDEMEADLGLTAGDRVVVVPDDVEPPEELEAHEVCRVYHSPE